MYASRSIRWRSPAPRPFLSRNSEDYAKVELSSKVFPDKAQWLECIQRRHLIVHSDGRVTSSYNAKVDWDNVSDPPSRPKVATHLSVTDEYLTLAIDLFEATGVLLAASVWRDWSPREAQKETIATIGTVVGRIAFERLESGNWRVASFLESWLESEASHDAGSRLISRFNYLQAIKRMGREQEVRDAIDSLDTSTLNLRFLTVRAALLDDMDEFASLLPRALDAGELSPEEVRFWPVFLEARSDERTERLVKAYERRVKRRQSSTKRRRTTSDSRSRRQTH